MGSKQAGKAKVGDQIFRDCGCRITCGYDRIGPNPTLIVDLKIKETADSIKGQMFIEKNNGKQGVPLVFLFFFFDTTS